jgi:hypothetical protein
MRSPEALIILAAQRLDPEAGTARIAGSSRLHLPSRRSAAGTLVLPASERAT